MTKTILLLILVINTFHLFAQKVNDEVKLKDLAVPNSPAFILTDITPSLIQTPNTPKQFILGIAQSYQQSSYNFPQNYSAEFVPYWWFKPSNRNVYTMLGFKTRTDDLKNVTDINEQDPFAGLKFISLSLAFLSKDLIPDTISVSQKIFSFGVRTTVLKIHQKTYGENLKSKIAGWHDEAQKELEIFQEAITRADPKKKAEMLKQLANYRPATVAGIVKEINDLINQKPIFSLDIAAAYATYGIGDSVWKSGRSGIWTTLSSYLPLALNQDQSVKNYFNLNFSLRYLLDNYHRNGKGVIAKTNSLDVGVKLALEFDQLSIGLESLYRYNKGSASRQNRTVGVINYKVVDNIYINGAFGKNFDNPHKLIALFGINWGIGTETINLPKTK